MTDRHNSGHVLQNGAWERIPWLTHGFTTRLAGDLRGLVSSEQIPAGLGLDGLTVASVRQVHSNGVHQIGGTEDLCRPEADALATNQPGYALTIRTADCLPLLFVDARLRAVAAVHAGWRGTAQGVAAKAVGLMQAEYGCHSEDVQVSIGPGIGPCCFEVGTEVAAAFNPSDVTYPVRTSGATAPRPHVDLVSANRRLLLTMGIRSANIHVLEMCTYCLTEQFFSYRCEGDRAGRMVAFIGMRPGKQ